ncbi:MAG: hypothetical protein Q7T04_00190 [Dehalococcoidia bacterium]|nr:hypothetical protein [Dehalococcoidia bacterium]
MTKKSAQFPRRNDKPQLDPAQRTQALVKRVRWIIPSFGVLAIFQSVLAIINDPNWKSWSLQDRILLIAGVVVTLAAIFAVLYFLVLFIIRRFFSKLLR